MITGFEIIKRLIISAVLGGLIGMEREVNNRPAGLRTHILVSLGSTLIMLVSFDGFSKAGITLGDPARLAAQVVSGIGFLGAGTIMRTGNNINGLTTAASLWVSAGIGLAIGAGYYLGAIFTSSIVLIALMSLGVFEKRFLGRKYNTIEVIGINKPGLIGDIGTLFGKHYIMIKDITILNGDLKYSNDENLYEMMELRFIVKIPISFNQELFNLEIYKLNGVKSVIFEGKKLLFEDQNFRSSLFDMD